MHKIEYENRLCVFIDILGWKNAIDKLSAEDIYEIFEPFLNLYNEHQYHQNFIKNAKNNANKSLHWLSQLIKGRCVKIPTFYEQVQLTIFSDSIVLSMPENWIGRVYDKIPNIIIGFLEKGFLIRGGISIGPLYHKEHIIFGPALIKAYELEHYDAKFPRILIDDGVIEKTGKDSYLSIMKDHLDNWIINPFPNVIAPENNECNWRNYLNNNFKVENVVNIIEKEIVKFSADFTLKNKWVFQAEVCAKSLEMYGASAEDLILKLRQHTREA